MKNVGLKSSLLLAFVLGLTLGTEYALAQSVDVKGVDSEGEGTTTIEIKKKKSTDTTPSKVELVWEIAEGSSDIQGEPAAMKKSATDSWKKACDEWKKEFRADNKDNKVINLNCGKPSCGGEAGIMTCTSTSSYKIKTRLN